MFGHRKRRNNDDVDEKMLRFLTMKRFVDVVKKNLKGVGVSQEDAEETTR